MNLVSNLPRNYKNNPDKICLVQGKNKIDYKELYTRVAAFAEYLKTKGIKKEDRILVLVPMSIDLYITLLALWSIGAVACFMDAGFIKSGMKRNEFNEITGVIGITKYLLYAHINKNIRKLKIKINSNTISKTNRKVLDYNQEDANLEIQDVNKDYPAILTYTSGTTGVPKIAARSHEFLSIQGKILEEHLNYEENDIELSSIPIFTLSNINVGITTVIADGNFSNLGKSNPVKLISQIDDNRINRIMAAPGLLNKIVDYCIEKNIKLIGVKKIFTGGGAIFLDYIAKLNKVFPNAKVYTLYGSTEAEPIAEMCVNEMTEKDIEDTKNGKGILAGSIIGVEDCKIIKENKEVIGSITIDEFKAMQTSEVGEIVVTGDNVLKGYVGGIGDKENKFSVDGKIYHRTGDMGLIDKNNKLWLRGRKKEPFFDIEAMLHAKYDVGKTAVFESDGKIILVLENTNKQIEEKIKNDKGLSRIDEIMYINKIPVDKRHSTKVDYKELRRKLGK